MGPVSRFDQCTRTSRPDRCRLGYAHGHALKPHPQPTTCRACASRFGYAVDQRSPEDAIVRCILAATDFSNRADRAVRRSALLARFAGARLELVHAVDPDRPQALVEAEAGMSRDLLDEQRSFLLDRFGIHAGTHLYEGEAFQGIAGAIEDLKPDLLVIGAYRRRLLQDTFVGTTAERAIRRSRIPVLMVNADAERDYVHVLAAVDLSSGSASALRTAIDLELNRETVLSVAHLFDAPAAGSLAQAALSKTEIRSYLAEEEQLAAKELDAFLEYAGVSHVPRLVRHTNGKIVAGLKAVAEDLGADLLVIGAGAGSGPARMLLGSTALAILATSARDVLVVPRPKQR
jgi:nucleotide-binding universal stress UspA family protein